MLCKDIHSLKLTLHLGVKPYACSMCDMRFFQRYHLERHSLTHTGMCPLTVPLICTQYPLIGTKVCIYFVVEVLREKRKKKTEIIDLFKLMAKMYNNEFLNRICYF